MLTTEQTEQRRLEEIAKRLIELEREQSALHAEYKALRRAYDMRHVKIEHVAPQRYTKRVVQKQDWFDRLGFGKD